MLEGGLADTERDTLEVHLEGCAACRERLEYLATGPVSPGAWFGCPEATEPPPGMGFLAEFRLAPPRHLDRTPGDLAHSAALAGM